MVILSRAEGTVERLTTGVLGRLLPSAALDRALAVAPRPRRCRKLPARFVLLFCVRMDLYADEALPHILRRVAGYWGPDAAWGATAGALCQARYRLGARPVVALFRQWCRPLATPTMPGAFLFGLRLLALDGRHLDLPDTPANERGFGRRPTPRGRSAWPQALVVLLVECGTRAVCDAGVWPGLTDERRAGRRLLRSTGPGTLVLWDRGFQNVAMVEAARARPGRRHPAGPLAPRRPPAPLSRRPRRRAPDPVHPRRSAASRASPRASPRHLPARSRRRPGPRDGRGVAPALGGRIGAGRTEDPSATRAAAAQPQAARGGARNLRPARRPLPPARGDGAGRARRHLAVAPQLRRYPPPGPGSAPAGVAVGETCATRPPPTSAACHRRPGAAAARRAEQSACRQTADGQLSRQDLCWPFGISVRVLHRFNVPHGSATLRRRATQRWRAVPACTR